MGSTPSSKEKTPTIPIVPTLREWYRERTTILVASGYTLYYVDADDGLVIRETTECSEIISIEMKGDYLAIICKSEATLFCLQTLQFETQMYMYIADKTPSTATDKVLPVIYKDFVKFSNLETGHSRSVKLIEKNTTLLILGNSVAFCTDHITRLYDIRTGKRLLLCTGDKQTGAVPLQVVGKLNDRFLLCGAHEEMATEGVIATMTEDGLITILPIEGPNVKGNYLLHGEHFTILSSREWRTYTSAGELFRESETPGKYTRIEGTAQYVLQTREEGLYLRDVLTGFVAAKMETDTPRICLNGMCLSCLIGQPICNKQGEKMYIAPDGYVSRVYPSFLIGYENPAWGREVRSVRIARDDRTITCNGVRIWVHPIVKSFTPKGERERLRQCSERLFSELLYRDLIGLVERYRRVID